MNNISLIPKKEKDSRNLPRFVTFQGPKLELSALTKMGLGLIAAVIAVTGGFYFWKYRLNKEVASFNTELQRLTSQRDMSLESRLNNLNNILEVFKGILDDHRYWSQVFKTLGEKTLNTVTFKSFDGNDDDSVFLLTGRAPSYGVLAQQIKILEDTAQVSSVKASNIGLAEDGRVDFTLAVSFSKDLIKRK